MIRNEARLFVRLVEDSSFNLVGPLSRKYFHLVKAFSDGKHISTKLLENPDVIYFDDSLESYSIADPLIKTGVLINGIAQTIEISKDEIKRLVELIK